MTDREINLDELEAVQGGTSLPVIERPGLHTLVNKSTNTLLEKATGGKPVKPAVPRKLGGALADGEEDSII